MPRSFAVAGAFTLAVLVACSANDGAPRDSTPTFHRDIEPIVARQCASCHRPGGIAPFSLLTYEDARAHGAAIRRATRERTMPPFNLDNSGACQTYADARWLDDAAIATIARWVEGGMPEGEGAREPIVVRSPPQLDRVDLTLDMGAPYTPDATLEDDYRCFELDPKLTQDRFVVGFQIRAGEPRMVHHLTLFALDSDEAEKRAKELDDAEPGAGYTCFGDTKAPSRWLVGSGPGGGALELPQGTGLRMKAGRKTILQMHYNRRNGTFPDQTKIDLKLATSVREEAFVPRLADLSLRLPPRMPAVSQSVSGRNWAHLVNAV